MTSVIAKNAGKAFIHVTKIHCLVTTLYKVFKRLQAFLFFFIRTYEFFKKTFVHQFLKL